MRDGFLYYFLMQAARRLPMLLFATGAIVFALIRWKRSPRASLMTAVAFVIYLIDWLVFTAFLYWFPEAIQSWKLTPSSRQWIEGIIFFLEDFVTAAIFILLTAAAFSGRNKEEPAQTT
ncbi:MAG TPA: hypothetical protein VFZ40_16225 [Pyrinomonadaceae bacterium]